MCSAHFEASDILGHAGSCGLRANALPFKYQASAVDKDFDVKPLLNFNLPSADPLSLEPPVLIPTAVRAYINSLERRLKTQAEKIKVYRSKIDTLGHTRSRQAKQIIVLKKKLLTWEPMKKEKTFVSLDDIKMANATSQALFRRFITVVTKTKSNRRSFPPELRDFCVRLYRHSRWAYLLVRQTLHLSLPKTRTIKHWIAEAKKAHAKLAMEAIEAVLSGDPTSANEPDQQIDLIAAEHLPGEVGSMIAPLTNAGELLNCRYPDNNDEAQTGVPFNNDMEIEYIDYCPDEILIVGADNVDTT